MIDPHLNSIIIRRRIGVLNGKKLNTKPIGFGEGNYLRKFSICTSLHGVIYLGEPKRPLFERLVFTTKYQSFNKTCSLLKICYYKRSIIKSQFYIIRLIKNTIFN